MASRLQKHRLGAAMFPASYGNAMSRTTYLRSADCWLNEAFVVIQSMRHTKSPLEAVLEVEPEVEMAFDGFSPLVF